MSEVHIDDGLLSQARAVASREGFASVEEFIASAVAERIGREKAARFLELTGQIRSQMESSGVSEGELLADFEQYRTRLHAADQQTS